MDSTQKKSLEALMESAQLYGKTTLELSKLQGLNATTNVLSILIARVSLLITIVVFVVIMSIGIALWLSEILGKSYYGFFVLSAFYFAMVMLVYFFLHRLMVKPFSRLIISQALDTK